VTTYSPEPRVMAVVVFTGTFTVKFPVPCTSFISTIDTNGKSPQTDRIREA